MKSKKFSKNCGEAYNPWQKLWNHTWWMFTKLFLTFLCLWFVYSLQLSFNSWTFWLHETYLKQMTDDWEQPTSFVNWNNGKDYKTPSRRKSNMCGNSLVGGNVSIQLAKANGLFRFASTLFLLETKLHFCLPFVLEMQIKKWFPLLDLETICQ